MIDLNTNLPTDFSNLGVVFLIGVVAGISTCGGLIASFVLGISARNIDTNSTQNFLQRIKPHLFFNLGRIFFFTLFGFLAGVIGQYLLLNNTLIGFLILFSSIYLLILGLKLLKISKYVDRLNLSFSFLEKISPKLVKFKDKSLSSNLGLFLLGGVTFFLPCGFTQAVQIYTLTLANPFYSALTLFVFAVGTSPGLLALASATSFISGKMGEILFKIIGLIVIYFSVINIISSINLLGLNVFINSSDSEKFKIINGYQEVKMTQTHKGYHPNYLIVKKDIPVRLVIDSKNNSTCASYIVIEEYGIRKFLELGENLIEFTPKKIGEIKFSCGMGMHPGVINVVDN